MTSARFRRPSCPFLLSVAVELRPRAELRLCRSLWKNTNGNTVPAQKNRYAGVLVVGTRELKRSRARLTEREAEGDASPEDEGVVREVSSRGGRKEQRGSR